MHGLVRQGANHSDSRSYREDESGHEAVPADCFVPDESELLASGEVGKQRRMASPGAEDKDQN